MVGHNLPLNHLLLMKVALLIMEVLEQVFNGRDTHTKVGKTVQIVTMGLAEIVKV